MMIDEINEGRGIAVLTLSSLIHRCQVAEEARVDYLAAFLNPSSIFPRRLGLVCHYALSSLVFE
jgi:hypothetical protein